MYVYIIESPYSCIPIALGQPRARVRVIARRASSRQSSSFMLHVFLIQRPLPQFSAYISASCTYMSDLFCFRFHWRSLLPNSMISILFVSARRHRLVRNPYLHVLYRNVGRKPMEGTESNSPRHKSAESIFRLQKFLIICAITRTPG